MEKKKSAVLLENVNDTRQNGTANMSTISLVQFYIPFPYSPVVFPKIKTSKILKIAMKTMNEFFVDVMRSHRSLQILTDKKTQAVEKSNGF